MELDKIEKGILKVVRENGGTLPPDFFAKKMQGLVKKGALETYFDPTYKGAWATYVYKLSGRV